MSILGASAHSLNRPDGETRAAPAATAGQLVILNWAQFYNFTADEWRMTILAILHEIKTECRMILIFVLKAETKEKQAQKWILTNVFFRLKIIDQKEWRISHSNLSWWNIHITLEDFVQFEGWTRGLPKGELWTFIFDSFDGKKYLVYLKTQVQTTIETKIDIFQFVENPIIDWIASIGEILKLFFTKCSFCNVFHVLTYTCATRELTTDNN